MFAKKTQKLVDELIEAEYQNAVEQYGEKYENVFKAFCVLQEEVLEAWNEMEYMKDVLGDRLLVAMNDEKNLKTMKSESKILLRGYIRTARHAIKELAQVCSVCEKFEATICEDQKATKGEE